MHNYESLAGIMALLGIFAFILFIITVGLYVLFSLGLYKLANNQGIPNSWLAWIPIANLYILGKIIKNIKISSLEISGMELVLPIGWFATAVLGNISIIGGIVSFIYIILTLFSLHKLYKIYRPEQAVLWLVLSIILPFMSPIFVFIMRNDIPIE